MDAVTVRMPGIVVAAAALRDAAASGAGDARLVALAFAVDRLQSSADDAELLAQRSDEEQRRRRRHPRPVGRQRGNEGRRRQAARRRQGVACGPGRQLARRRPHRGSQAGRHDLALRQRRIGAPASGADRQLQRQSAHEAGDRRRGAHDRARAAIRGRARHHRPTRRSDARHARTRGRQFRRHPRRRRPQGRNRPDRRRRRKLQAARGGESARRGGRSGCAASRRNPPPKPEPPPSENASRPNRRRRSARWPPDWPSWPRNVSTTASPRTCRPPTVACRTTSTRRSAPSPRLSPKSAA